MHIAYMVWTLLVASKVTIASKQPRRPSLTSYFKSVTPITYLSMCILLIWSGPFWQPLRSLQPPNSLGGQVWPHISNQWPQLHKLPCPNCSNLPYFVNTWRRRRRGVISHWPDGFAAGKKKFKIEPAVIEQFQFPLTQRKIGAQLIFERKLL